MAPCLAPASRIGILGGGQLGRMLARAAARLGFDCVVFDPDQDCPAGRSAAQTVTAAYEDLDAVARFAQSVDAVTYEFENVPAATAQIAAAHAPLRPGVKALGVAQDRLTEKTFLNRNGAETAAFRAVQTVDELTKALGELGLPAVLKTRRFGYDGKGQAVIRDKSEAAAALAVMNGQPAILEAFVDFARELSIIAARSADGTVQIYPLAENRHADGLLRESLAPAHIDPCVQEAAEVMVTGVLNALEYVGVIAMELFALGHGALLANEIAPRVHNTGHWTQDACAVCQFEQHIRAVAGWPLGNPAPHHAAHMVNLIGEDVDDWAQWLQIENAVLHLYGKRETRAGRKMGHVNVLSALSDR